MKKIAILLLILTGCAYSPKVDKVYTFGDYRLEIQYLQKGTRSEGIHGRLYLGNKEIQPDKTKTIQAGKTVLKFYGLKREVPWATTGWNYADKKQIKHSWQK